MSAQSFRGSVTDALKFWEPLRLVYNGILAAIVIGYFLAEYPASRSGLTIDSVFTVFILAVLANVAYCAPYVPDLFAQASGFRNAWRRFRWLLFAIGLAFAGILTRFFCLAFFAHQAW